MTQHNVDPAVEQAWREVLMGEHHSRLGLLPGTHRCRMCRIPLAGIGSVVTKPLGYRPSRKSPHLCNVWDTKLPPGGAEIDIAVLFADVRGSTELGEGMGPAAFAAMLNRFYATATRALLDHNAVIDKMVGDEVMALYIPGPTGPGYRQAAVLSAVDLIRAMGYGKGEPWLPIGIGVHAGLAYVGKIGTSEIQDFTALGDTVNTAARLQAEAQPGEVVMSEELYADVESRFPDAERRSLEVKGKAQPIAVRVLHAAQA